MRSDLDLEGNGHPELRIAGYAGGRLVLERSFSSDETRDRFVLAVDDRELVADGSDATRLAFKVVDHFGAERAFAGSEVGFELAGPGELVGDNPLSLGDSGGVGAVWVRTLARQPGQITVRAVHSSLGAQSITVIAKG